MNKYLSLIVVALVLILQSCNNKKASQEQGAEQVTPVTTKDLTPLEQGEAIAMQAQGELAKNLLQALNSQGPEYALAFCNERAITLTDSMGSVLSTNIKRVSDKPRNKENLAGPAAMGYIEASKLIMEDGMSPKPFLYDDGTKKQGFYPILANKMCMQCHGQPNSQILSGTLAKLETLYPDDMATGYSEGDLRGIWIVDLKE